MNEVPSWKFIGEEHCPIAEGAVEGLDPWENGDLEGCNPYIERAAKPVRYAHDRGTIVEGQKERWLRVEGSDKENLISIHGDFFSTVYYYSSPNKWEYVGTADTFVKKLRNGDDPFGVMDLQPTYFWPIGQYRIMQSDIKALHGFYSLIITKPGVIPNNALPGAVWIKWLLGEPDMATRCFMHHKYDFAYDFGTKVLSLHTKGDILVVPV